MKYFIENCSKEEFLIYLRTHLVQGERAASLEKFTLSGITVSYKTSYYGRMTDSTPWITYINSEQLFRLGQPMNFYFEIAEKDGGCEIIGKWCFPRWYRKSSVVYLILPLFIELFMGFTLKGLALLYLIVFIAYCLYYAMSRLSAPEDKITELFNNASN